MRLAVRSITAFNTATAVWLAVMFMILRHSGFEINAAVALGIAGFCALTFASAGASAAAWLRSTALAGSVVLAACGAWAIYTDLQPGANFEGFVLIIGAAWVVQGLVAVLSTYASAGVAPAAGPRA